MACLEREYMAPRYVIYRGAASNKWCVADSHRAARVPQRPTTGSPPTPTRRQKDAKRSANGGRVSAVVRHRMTPRGRSRVPVNEEDDSDEDVPCDPTAVGGDGSAEPDSRRCATALAKTPPRRQHAGCLSTRQTDRRPVAQRGLTSPAHRSRLRLDWRVRQVTRDATDHAAPSSARGRCHT